MFEAESKAGGQLRIGVPPNRLPREAVNREIEILSETRVDIQTGRRVEDLETLMQEGIPTRAFSRSALAFLAVSGSPAKSFPE